MERKKVERANIHFCDLKPERGFKLEYHQTKSCKVEANSAGWKGECPLGIREHIYSSFTSIFIVTENTFTIFKNLAYACFVLTLKLKGTL